MELWVWPGSPRVDLSKGRKREVRGGYKRRGVTGIKTCKLDIGWISNKVCASIKNVFS